MCVCVCGPGGLLPTRGRYVCSCELCAIARAALDVRGESRHPG